MSTSSTPTLLGIIIDVSVSMKRSWKNRDGQKLPRIQVIRDVLNQQIRNAASVKHSGVQAASVEVFALGMGFKRTLRWSGVDMSYGRERRLQGQVQTFTDVGVVCDILALAELLPNLQDFQKLSGAINDKWNQYVSKLIAQTKPDDNIEDQLREFLRVAFHNRALRRFHQSFSFRLLTLLRSVDTNNYPKVISSGMSTLQNRLEQRDLSITQKSNTVSTRFFANIIAKAKEHFDQEKEELKDYIETTIKDFVLDQCILLSNLIVLGYDIGRLIDAVDEPTLDRLAKQIYTHLSQRIGQNIAIAWEINRVILFAEAASVGIKLDQRKLKDLTEKCIQSYSWNHLKPYIQETVTSIFSKTFDEIAKDNRSTWIGLATHREVIRLLQDVPIILPETVDQSLFAEDVMFGATPIDEAITLASLRLLDRRFTGYNKVLIIISDGKFETASSVTPARMLQEAGVSIITCYVTERDIVPDLPSKRMSKWPQGAKLMYEMSSFYSDHDFISRTLKDRGYKAKDGVKLFCQVNHSEVLGEIAAAILSPDE
jgi:hypothetical protein